MNNEWFSVNEAAGIEGVTPRAIRKGISKNKYITRKVKTPTGFKYEIMPESLGYNTQNLIDFEKSKNEIEKNREPSLQKENPVPTHAKQIALARYDLVNLWVDYRKISEKKTEAGKEFLDAYNGGKMYPVLFNVLGKVSIGTIYRWHKKIKIKNDYTLLIPNYDYGEKEGTATLAKEEEIVFKSLLLAPNKINIGKATTLTKDILAKRGYKSTTSSRSFRRYANQFMRKNYDKWIYAREGEKALRDKVMPYISRDISKIEVGDVLVADGHRLAIECINPFTGRPCRPTLIGYLDWKSTALVGYEIMLEENTQAITSALRNAIINLGKTPKICYQDNGKAFRAKFFTGDLHECGINGLFDKLKIIPVFAQPYNARAKIIERFFRELQDTFERLLPSFVGANINDKPAYKKRNEEFHKENHNEFIPTIEQLNKMFKAYIDFHRKQDCPNVKGKSIGEVFDNGKGTGVNIEELDELMMHEETRTVHRDGIRFLNANYYSEDLYGIYDRVLIKYSLSDITQIKVYTTNNEFICYAKRTILTHPMAQHLGNIQDQEQLKFELKQQKKLLNKTKKEVKKYFKTKQKKPVEWQNIPQIETNIVPDNDSKDINTEYSDGRPIFNSNFERYEWLSVHGFADDKDVAWFKAFEYSNEYKQMYGRKANEK